MVEQWQDDTECRSTQADSHPFRIPFLGHVELSLLPHHTQSTFLRN